MPTIHRTLLVASLLASMPGFAAAQGSERWYQVEVAVFMQEYADRQSERWPSEAPALSGNSPRSLSSWLSWLSLDSWQQESAADEQASVETAAPQPFWSSAEPALLAPAPLPVPPLPPVQQPENALRLPDEHRQAFFLLGPSESQFSESLRRLEQSPAYRLLFHAAWRQPMTGSAQAQPVQVEGGFRLDTENGPRHELEGALRFFFNPGQDRVILDSQLWLNNLQRTGPDTSTYYIPLTQQRDMRSNEFHYLDHPVAGIIAMVAPYELPPALPPALLVLPGTEMNAAEADNPTDEVSGAVSEQDALP